MGSKPLIRDIADPKGGIPWCLGAMRDIADPSPIMDELKNVAFEMIKLINTDYNRRAPPYTSKTTIDDLLLAAGDIKMPCRSPIRWVFF